MKKLVFTLIVAVFVGGPFVAKAFACGGWFEPACGTAAQQVQDNQAKMEAAVPLPQLQDSLERANISKRLQEFSNPNKVSYIYLISYGKVMAFYTVKGKVTSGSKRLTSSQEMVDGCGNILQPGQDGNNCSGGSSVISAPELDGTYGDSGSYIYFWDTGGVYHQWNGEYLEVDQPQQLSTPPDLVQEVK